MCSASVSAFLSTGFLKVLGEFREILQRIGLETESSRLDFSGDLECTIKLVCIMHCESLLIHGKSRLAVRNWLACSMF